MRTIFQSKDMIQQVELFEWPSYKCNQARRKSLQSLCLSMRADIALKNVSKVILYFLFVLWTVLNISVYFTTRTYEPTISPSCFTLPCFPHWMLSHFPLLFTYFVTSGTQKLHDTSLSANKQTNKQTNKHKLTNKQRKTPLKSFF